MFSPTCSVLNFSKVAKNVWKNQAVLSGVLSRFQSSGNEYVEDFKDDSGEYLSGQRTSPAMTAYLERANAHEKFMAKHTYEFNVGRRHLANMMGKDAETFTQADIDEAIEYLFPSGLFEPKARTLMKPPEEIYPARKEAEFDATGRPHHWLFYTSRPNFFNLLFNTVAKLKDLNDYEDQQIKQGLTPPDNTRISTVGMEWLPKNVLEEKLLETIDREPYKQFISLMDRFILHPYAYLAPDYYEPLRRSLAIATVDFSPVEPQYTKDGIAYVTTKDCWRVSADAEVTVYYPGTGKISINGQDLTYFTNAQAREQILFPLLMSKMLNKVDIVAKVWAGGPTSQAGSVRWGISMGLRNFVDDETRHNMILAGLLTRDLRQKERKKPGQEGARRKYTWKKR